MARKKYCESNLVVGSGNFMTVAIFEQYDSKSEEEYAFTVQEMQ